MSGLPLTRGASGRGAHSSYHSLAKGLGYFSIGLGLVELFGAAPLSRALGMHGRTGLLRAYGAREVATGVSILTSHDPTPWIWGRVVGDALDLGTLAGASDPKGDRQHTNLAAATAAVAALTLIDVMCGLGLSAEKRLPPAGAYDYADRTGFPRSAQAMRGAASDFKAPADFRIPEPLRPWHGHA